MLTRAIVFVLRWKICMAGATLPRVPAGEHIRPIGCGSRDFVKVVTSGILLHPSCGVQEQCLWVKPLREMEKLRPSLRNGAATTGERNEEHGFGIRPHPDARSRPGDAPRAGEPDHREHGRFLQGPGAAFGRLLLAGSESARAKAEKETDPQKKAKLYEKAKQEFSKAVGYHTNYDALLGLGQVYLVLGQKSSALDACAKAQWLKPHDPVAKACMDDASRKDDALAAEPAPGSQG